MDERCTNLYFNIIKPLGNNEGKNSKVFLATDTQLDANLVIKQVDKNTFKNPDDYFAESRYLYASKHPHVMEIQYASQDDDFIYFAMPCMEKGSLYSLMKEYNLNVREIIKYSLEFLSGLHYVHSKELIHFDIKPTNILLSNSNHALLTDFGLAKHIDDDGLAYQDYLYNAHRAPECFVRSVHNISVDIYQVGLTLYRMCNGYNILGEQLKNLGVKNYDDLKSVVISGDYPDRNFYLPHIPLKLRKIVNKSMDIDYKERYSNVLDIINDLSGIEENLDWVYNKNKNICFGEYYKITDKYKLSIQVIDNDKTYDIITKKVNLSTGRESKVLDYCKNGYTNYNKLITEIGKIISKID